MGSEKEQHYRNKLEFTFSNRRWLSDEEIQSGNEFTDRNGLGFHIPGMFDRVVNIEHCWLQQDPSNKIRLELRDYVLQKGYSFYDVKKWTGLLRNLIIRNTSTGELMVIVVFREKDDLAIADVMGFLDSRFPEINALMYVVNGKKNDQKSDLEVIPYSGRDHIIEEMPAYMKGGEPLKFKIGPVSFFQTNSLQAYQLYRIGLDFADFSGDEVVYDLYTGTGTIANYIAGLVKRVVGIEYVPSAIEDAEENARFNGISNTSFFAGDMVKVLDDSFIEENGQPDVVITDPPRAGMHEKVVHQIIKMAPEKIIYISCNPATQARDIALMDPCYEIMQIRPVDMFPHTQHVENVVSLRRRETTLNSKFQIPNPKQIPNSKAPHPLNPPAPFSPSP